MIRPQKSLVLCIYKIEKGFKNDNKLKEELIEKIKKYIYFLIKEINFIKN